MIKRVLLLLFVSVLFLSCEENLKIEVKLDQGHPWERESARQFWYTIVYHFYGEVHFVTLPIGVRKINLEIPRDQTTFFIAYPLGEGLPFGGAYYRGSQKRVVSLKSEEGLLCEALLHIAKSWPKCVNTLNYPYLVNEIRDVDENLYSIDWSQLGKSIIEGSLNNSSIVRSNLRDVVLENIPVGKWVCENKSFSSFTVYGDEDIVLESLGPSVLRFLNLNLKLQLKIVVPTDLNEEVFYYIGPINTLLTISDSAYYQLINKE
jgi:hypothetical protein